MLKNPRAIIIRSAGINCDEELAHAFDLAGARADLVHLNVLVREPERLDEFDLIAFPGGFSFGDDVAGGAIFAMHVRERLYPSLLRCIERETPIFAVCNGFQVAAKVGLLPGPGIGENWPTDHPPKQTVTLTDNSTGRFIDDWVGVEVNRESPCIWTRGLEGEGEVMMLPMAHGEGRFVAEPAVIDEIETSNRVALRYMEGSNLNGSMNRIAGICDSTGLILGLMPHPERFVAWHHHPFWTRLSNESRRNEEPIGLRIFRNAVEFARVGRVGV